MEETGCATVPLIEQNRKRGQNNNQGALGRVWKSENQVIASE